MTIQKFYISLNHRTKRNTKKNIMKNNKIKTQKVWFGLYFEPITAKYISVHEGTIERVWSIYNDKFCTDEYVIGFRTLSDAKEFLSEVIEFNQKNK